MSLKTQSLVLAGIVGPLVYAVVLTVLGTLEPGYDPIMQSMSELGAVNATNAIIMNTLGFFLLGVMMVLFAIGLYACLPRSRLSAVGPVFIVASGMALALTGVFQCDAGCIDVTMMGSLHSLFATLAAIIMIPAPALVATHASKNPNWSRYALFSWTVTLLTAGLSALYSIPEIEGVTGLLQRVSMAVPMFWIVVTAYIMLRSQD